MKDAHSKLRISDLEFNATAENLQKAFYNLNVPQNLIDEVISIVATTRNDVVNVKPSENNQSLDPKNDFIYAIQQQENHLQNQQSMQMSNVLIQQKPQYAQDSSHHRVRTEPSSYSQSQDIYPISNHLQQQLQQQYYKIQCNDNVRYASLYNKQPQQMVTVVQPIVTTIPQYTPLHYTGQVEKQLQYSSQKNLNSQNYQFVSQSYNNTPLYNSQHLKSNPDLRSFVNVNSQRQNFIGKNVQQSISNMKLEKMQSDNEQLRLKEDNIQKQSSHIKQLQHLVQLLENKVFQCETTIRQQSSELEKNKIQLFRDTQQYQQIIKEKETLQQELKVQMQQCEYFMQSMSENMNELQQNKENMYKLQELVAGQEKMLEQTKRELVEKDQMIVHLRQQLGLALQLANNVNAEQSDQFQQHNSSFKGVLSSSSFQQGHQEPTKKEVLVKQLFTMFKQRIKDLEEKLEASNARNQSSQQKKNYVSQSYTKSPSKLFSSEQQYAQQKMKINMLNVKNTNQSGSEYKIDTLSPKGGYVDEDMSNDEQEMAFKLKYMLKATNNSVNKSLSEVQQKFPSNKPLFQYEGGQVGVNSSVQFSKQANQLAQFQNQYQN